MAASYRANRTVLPQDLQADVAAASAENTHENPPECIFMNLA
jgi:hypothetical protein